VTTADFQFEISGSHVQIIQCRCILKDTIKTKQKRSKTSSREETSSGKNNLVSNSKENREEGEKKKLQCREKETIKAHPKGNQREKKNKQK
jgi:hypothetical protein